MEPGDEWICYVTYSPSQPGTSSATTVINDINEQPVLSWTANLTSQLPPVVTVGNDVVVLADSTSYTERRTLTVGNVEGASDLEWTAELKFKRGNDVPESVYETVSPASMDVLQSEVNPLANVNAGQYLKSTQNYNRTLAYTDKTEG